MCPLGVRVSSLRVSMACLYMDVPGCMAMRRHGAVMTQRAMPAVSATHGAECRKQCGSHGSPEEAGYIYRMHLMGFLCEAGLSPIPSAL